MKLGFVSAILPDQTLEEVVVFAAETGYQCLELMCWPPGKAERRYAGVTHIDVLDLDRSRADQILATLRDAAVEISALGYYPNPLTPDRDEAQVAIDHLSAVIRAAPLLSVDTVTTFIGRDWTQSVDANWPRFLEVWQPLIALAEETGVRVAIENCPMSFTADEWPGGKNLAISPATWRRMFADLPSPNFGLNYDPSHMIWQHMDYLAPLREFADRMFHIHAKDVRIDRARLNDVGIMATPHEYHTPKLPGLGDVDWGHFFSVLSDIGYTGPVCVEVEDRAYEGPLERRHASLRQSHTYLKNFVA